MVGVNFYFLYIYKKMKLKPGFWDYILFSVTVGDVLCSKETKTENADIIPVVDRIQGYYWVHTCHGCICACMSSLEIDDVGGQAGQVGSACNRPSPCFFLDKEVSPALLLKPNTFSTAFGAPANIQAGSRKHDLKALQTSENVQKQKSDISYLE